MQRWGRMERRPWGDPGASKHLGQKLTARAKTSALSPSEVHVLCSGQSSSTQTSSRSTCSAVLLLETITLHMVAAALQAQSSVSEGSWPQCRGLGNRGGWGWPPALPRLCPLPLASSTQQACPCGQQAAERRCLEGQGGSTAAGSGAVVPGLGNGGAGRS